MKRFITYTFHKILLGRSNEGIWRGRGIYLVWERWKIDRDHPEDIRVDGRIILEQI
jgi:hypothetical protein